MPFIVSPIQLETQDDGRFQIPTNEELIASIRRGYKNFDVFDTHEEAILAATHKGKDDTETQGVEDQGYPIIEVTLTNTSTPRKLKKGTYSYVESEREVVAEEGQEAQIERIVKDITVSIVNIRNLTFEKAYFSHIGEGYPNEIDLPAVTSRRRTSPRRAAAEQPAAAVEQPAAAVEQPTARPSLTNRIFNLNNAKKVGHLILFAAGAGAFYYFGGVPYAVAAIAKTGLTLSPNALLGVKVGSLALAGFGATVAIEKTASFVTTRINALVERFRNWWRPTPQQEQPPVAEGDANHAMERLASLMGTKRVETNTFSLQNNSLFVRQMGLQATPIQKTTEQQFEVSGTVTNNKPRLN